MDKKRPEVSIILPCLNEEKAIGRCLDQIKNTIKANEINAEIIVVDNGSTDNSCNIIKRKKVKLIHEKERGYGAAYLRGFKEAKGEYIFMADSDGSYDFNEIPGFIKAIKEGYDLVIGNRFAGNIEEGAMPWSHRLVGNPILSGALRIFFKAKIKDCHSGMRAIRKESLEKINLRTIGMEFASEMIIKAIKNNLKIKELPIKYYKRSGKSKLRSISDGWRHLRFMLIYSPDYVFIKPGFLLTLLGFIIMILMVNGNLNIGGIKFRNHPMFIGSVLSILGYQLILTGIFAKIYAHNHLKEKNQMLEKIYQFLNLEKSIIVGLIFFLAGLYIFLNIFILWISKNFGGLDTINISIFATTFIVLGIQTIFSGFFFSILGIKER